MSRGAYYFFHWRCLVCQDIARMLLAANPSIVLVSHKHVTVRDRSDGDGGPICGPHDQTEGRERPYFMTEDDLPPAVGPN